MHAIPRDLTMGLGFTIEGTLGGRSNEREAPTERTNVPTVGTAYDVKVVGGVFTDWSRFSSGPPKVR